MAFIASLGLWGEHLLLHYGLVGLFFISVITSSTVLVYTPSWLIFIIAGHFYNPLLVALIGGLGGTIGEFVPYFLGRGGNYLIEKEVSRKQLIPFKKIEGWFMKHGFILFPIFAAGPFPMDILSVVAGGLKYSKRKFFAGVFIGKFIKCLFLAYLGYRGLHILGL